MDEYTPFYFTSSNRLPLNSFDIYLKPLSDKFINNTSRLELINCMLSIETELL